MPFVLVLSVRSSLECKLVFVMQHLFQSRNFNLTGTQNNYRIKDTSPKKSLFSERIRKTYSLCTIKFPLFYKGEKDEEEAIEKAQGLRLQHLTKQEQAFHTHQNYRKTKGKIL